MPNQVPLPCVGITETSMYGTTKGRQRGRFELVTAGHHFLLNVVPFRKPASHDVLRTFIAVAESIDLSPIEVDAVLLRCLAILNRHSTASVPGLVERYLSNAQSFDDCVKRFSQCIEDMLRFHCIADRSVQEAIYLINARYAESECTPAFVAETLGLRLSTLDVAFKRETGRSPSEHIRGVRLERSAILLATTNLSIKEVWSRIGYNHHSNFDHDFKQRFRMTPREYRAQAIGPIAREIYSARKTPLTSACIHSSPRKERVLIVDDDEGTRATVGTYLQLQGYSVACAATGADGLHEALEGSPDVVLLDYHLGDIDGLDLLRALRGRFTGNHPAVALFTADWEIVDRSAEVAALNALIVSKLCDIDRVGELIVYLSGQTNRPT